jgi:hypothetical protein
MTRHGKIARLPAAIREELVNEGYDGSVNPELTRPPNQGQSKSIQLDYPNEYCFA